MSMCVCGSRLGVSFNWDLCRMIKKSGDCVYPSTRFQKVPRESAKGGGVNLQVVGAPALFLSPPNQKPPSLFHTLVSLVSRENGKGLLLFSRLFTLPVRPGVLQLIVRVSFATRSNMIPHLCAETKHRSILRCSIFSLP